MIHGHNTHSENFDRDEYADVRLVLERHDDDGNYWWLNPADGETVIHKATATGSDLDVHRNYANERMSWLLQSAYLGEEIRWAVWKGSS